MLLSTILMFRDFSKSNGVDRHGCRDLEPGSGFACQGSATGNPCDFTFLHVFIPPVTLAHTPNSQGLRLIQRLGKYNTSPSHISLSRVEVPVSSASHILRSPRYNIQNPKCACSGPTPHNSYFRQGFGSQTGDYVSGLAAGLVPLPALTNRKL